MVTKVVKKSCFFLNLEIMTKYLKTKHNQDESSFTESVRALCIDRSFTNYEAYLAWNCIRG